MSVGSRPIPQALWDQAVALTCALSYSHGAQQWRLSPSALQQQIQAQHAAVGQLPAAALPFVEIPQTSAIATALPETEIELQRAAGARLRLRTGHATLPLAAVVRALLEEA